MNFDFSERGALTMFGEQIDKLLAAELRRSTTNHKLSMYSFQGIKQTFNCKRKQTGWTQQNVMGFWSFAFEFCVRVLCTSLHEV